MRIWILFVFVTAAWSQAKGEPAPNEQINQFKFLQVQREIELSRLEAQTERIRLQTELMQLQLERERDKEPREKSIIEIVGDYQKKKAADEAVAEADAERMQNPANESARATDSIYLGAAVALPVVLAYFLAMTCHFGILQRTDCLF